MNYIKNLVNYVKTLNDELKGQTLKSCDLVDEQEKKALIKINENIIREYSTTVKCAELMSSNFLLSWTYKLKA